MSSYFFKLEKAQARYNSILQLNVDGTVTDNKKDISTFCHNYYSSLYKSKFDKCAMFDFFSCINSVNSISQEEKLRCDSPIMLLEVIDAINHLKNNKSPRNNGITSEFYKHFSELVAPFLLEGI